MFTGIVPRSKVVATVVNDLFKSLEIITRCLSALIPYTQCGEQLVTANS